MSGWPVGAWACNFSSTSILAHVSDHEVSGLLYNSGGGEAFVEQKSVLQIKFSYCTCPPSRPQPFATRFEETALLEQVQTPLLQGPLVNSNLETCAISHSGTDFRILAELVSNWLRPNILRSLFVCAV